MFVLNYYNGLMLNHTTGNLIYKENCSRELQRFRKSLMKMIHKTFFFQMHILYSTLVIANVCHFLNHICIGPISKKVLILTVYFHLVAVCISGCGGLCDCDQLRTVVYVTEAELQYTEIFISVSAQILIISESQLN